jgi:gliding motility-associated-like protein
MNRHSFCIGVSFSKLTLGFSYTPQLLFLLTFIFMRVYMHAQTPAPPILFQKTLGGSSNETLNCTYATSDGGYVLGGQTSSSNGDVQGVRKGLTDALIVKTNAAGTVEWMTDLGGSKDDIITSVKESSDKGFIVEGYTASTDGDFLSNHGGTDIFVVKLSKTGSVEWIKCFGGTLDEKSSEVVVSTESGYLISGSAKSYNGDLLGKSPVDSDSWVVKITDSGTISWQILFNGLYTDLCKAAKQLPNKNYIIVSNIGVTSGANQREDIFVSIIAPNGNVIGQNSYGGSQKDLANCLEITSDGGCIVIGKSSSNNGDLSNNQGNYDIWLLKLGANGSKQWSKTFGGGDAEGGTGVDVYAGIKPTNDAGYVFTTSTDSKNGDIKTTPWLGQARVWVVKLNCKQEIQWQKVIGGSAGEYGVFVEQKTDKSYFVMANTKSNDGDISGNKGGQDFWLIKLDKDPKMKANLAISGPLEFCEGNSIKLNTDIGVQYKYQWQKDGIVLPTETNPRITITKSGEYKVIITPKDCPKPQADTSVIVKVNQNPVLGLPTDTIFCKTPTSLKANTINGAIYKWSSGETSPNISPTSSGVYKLNVKLGGCEVDSSVNVKVGASPVIALRPQIEDCFDTAKPYLLSAGTDYTLNYRWLPNNETSPNISVSKEGIYKVKVTNSDGCITEKSVQMILKCTSKIYAATIFTPNGDNENDVFWIIAQDVIDYDLDIFNRWGEMIFMSSSESEVWDGTIKGEKAPEGAYSWRLTYKNASQPTEILTQTGTVILIR